MVAAVRDAGQPRPKSFYFLLAFFLLFIAFLYGPMLSVYILSFQGPEGGMGFPMKGFSLHWFQVLFEGPGAQGIGDIPNAFNRSMRLAFIVAALTMVVSVAAGMGFRRPFPGYNFVFYLVIASLVMPGIFVGFGIALGFNLLGLRTQWFSSGIGAQLTWTLPFGVLIMFIIMGRFNPAYEEAARDLGASSRQRFFEIIFPIILPGVIGICMAGFTGSYEEAARSSLTVGTGNTMPMEITMLLTAAASPVLFSIGTLTTGLSFAIVLTTALVTSRMAKRRQMSI